MPSGAGVIRRTIWLAAANQEQDAQLPCQKIIVLKSRKYAYPELEVNILRRLRPADAHPAKM